jgi:hypothetical protein
MLNVKILKRFKLVFLNTCEAKYGVIGNKNNILNIKS